MTLTPILFDLGCVHLLPEAAEALKESGEEAEPYLSRHVTGDWGELSREEVAANTLALAIGGELLSCYLTSAGTSLRIMTEADRSATYIYLHDRQTERREAEKSGVDPDMVFGSFASAVGLALGDILLLTRRPERLGECLASIEVTVYATLLSVSAEIAGGPSARSLSSAALRVVREWHEKTENLADLGDAIQALQDVLELMGVRYVAADCREE
jgi:hypothetical protein